MADDEEKSSDFYTVLGLKKECTEIELRNAYKKLALRWHPDRFTSSRNSKSVEEAKEKFQAIHEAYSVLSNSNKRFLYDVGVYDCDDDDDKNEMGDFLNEMAAMMSQNKSNDNNGEESFGDLQELFKEMFQTDIEAFCSSSQTGTSYTCTSSSFSSCGESPNITSKRNSMEISYGKGHVGEYLNFDAQLEGFCLGVKHPESSWSRKGAGGRIPLRGGSSRRDGRKQKVSSGHDVSSNDCSSTSAS